MGGFWLQIGVELEWRCGLVVVVARQLGSTMVLPAIWSYDRVVVVWQLLVIVVSLVWIDVEEGFDVRIGCSTAVCQLAYWCLQMIGSSEIARI